MTDAALLLFEAWDEACPTQAVAVYADARGALWTSSRSIRCERRGALQEPIGPYRHSKTGRVYIALCTADDAESGERRMLYRGADGRVWSRAEARFHEAVVLNGQPQPRYSRCAPPALPRRADLA